MGSEYMYQNIVDNLERHQDDACARYVINMEPMNLHEVGAVHTVPLSLPQGAVDN